MQIAAEVGLSRAAVAVLVNEPRKPARDVAGNYW